MISLQALREAAEKATPSPWTHDAYPLLAKESAIDWVCASLSKGGDGIHLVQSALPKIADDEEHPTVMLTGNGPTSEANATFISLASPSTVLKLCRIAEAGQKCFPAADGMTTFDPVRAMEELRTALAELENGVAVNERIWVEEKAFLDSAKYWVERWLAECCQTKNQGGERNGSNSGAW